ncbi:methyltransferase domain-containing protein [Pyxidicoccus fallax]|uniref:Class I SAM-dependent methyltransferase n=1 Tax=Pyxidicoccus fallax TaxID=394095 RepID=A0A848L3K8_9BACT|nr:class I SAM-dependent methyltransferase [Pyxidicoccus fallax]NMO13510.1 class I SAM-dependent methyltransferase [Pyxidicoccus fallax]NPC78539.1 methyltransferase domain-containing protein [Pyxidicoccus fallax]
MPPAAEFTRILLVSLALVVSGCASRTAAPPPPEQGHPPKGHHHGGPAAHRFEDAEQWAARFEDPERDAWQKPDVVISAMDIPPGSRVADIGAATGYFPVRIARAHPDVKVYGVDIEPDMVRYLDERARREGLTHIHAVLGEPGDAKLPEPVDRILLVDTYHHIEERPAYFRALAGSLRAGGRVIVVDFKVDSPLGPRKEHKLAPEQVIEELAAAGYRKVGERELPHQYVLIFERV